MELGWIRCEICNKRLPTNNISIKGITLNVCIYCFTAISTYLEHQTRRSKLEPDEDILKKFKTKPRKRKEVS